MALMTGNAFTMTIPQLDNVIKKLKAKLEDKSISESTTLSTKVENLIYDYTKAKNKILRYYEKTKSRHPELVVGKKNSLTIVQIMKNKGNLGKANRLSSKQQKWAYNAADFMKDIRGFALGIAGTTLALGVADMIVAKATGSTLFNLIGEGISAMFGVSIPGATLAVTGAGLLAALIAVPAIGRLIHKIKKNKTALRDMNNMILEETSMNDIDLKSQDIQQIKEILLGNPELLNTLKGSSGFDYSQYTPLEASKLKSAVMLAEAENAKTIRQNYTEAGKESYKELNYNKFLKEFDDASKLDRDEKKVGAIKPLLDQYNDLKREMIECDFDEKLKNKTEADKNLKARKTALDKAKSDLELAEKKEAEVDALLDKIKNALNSSSTADATDTKKIEEIQANINEWRSGVRDLQNLLTIAKTMGFCDPSVGIEVFNGNPKKAFSASLYNASTITPAQEAEINRLLRSDKKSPKFKVVDGKIEYKPFNKTDKDKVTFDSFDEFMDFVTNSIKSIKDARAVVSGAPIPDPDLKKLDQLGIDYITEKSAAQAKLNASQLRYNKAEAASKKANEEFEPVAGLKDKLLAIIKELKDVIKDLPEVKGATGKIDYYKIAKKYHDETAINIQKYADAVEKLKELGFKNEKEMIAAANDLTMELHGRSHTL